MHDRDIQLLLESSLYLERLRRLDVLEVDAPEGRTHELHGIHELVGIEHQKEGSSRTTTLWCAPELDYLPVIIEQHRLGKLKFRATLTSYTPT